MLDNDMLRLSLTTPQHIKLHRGSLKAIIKEGGVNAFELYQQLRKVSYSIAILVEDPSELVS